MEDDAEDEAQDSAEGDQQGANPELVRDQAVVPVVVGSVWRTRARSAEEANSPEQGQQHKDDGADVTEANKGSTGVDLTAISGNEDEPHRCCSDKNNGQSPERCR